EVNMDVRGNTKLLFVVILLLVGISCLLAWPLLRRSEGPRFETEYQAVLLTGGQVYFGKLEGFGTAYPILREAYYVQNVLNPDTKQQSSVLVQRGSEWHGPDRMYLNPGHIILVEPVGANSAVAKLIADKK